MSDKTCILVTGLPRSGTSTVSQLLDRLGVYFGDPANFLDTTIHKHNPVFYELQWVNDLNDRVIANLGSSYFDDFFPIESDFDTGAMRALETESLDRVRREFGDRPLIGLKDPRICFTLPFWLRLLATAGFDTKLLVTLRNQSAVVRSNALLRDDRPCQWRRFYARHLLTINYFARDLSMCRIDFDRLIVDPRPVAAETARCLGLDMDDPVAATGHIGTGLYHHKPEPDTGSDPYVDAVDADLRAGTLEPGRYLQFRQIASLYADDRRAVEAAGRCRAERDVAELTAAKDQHIAKLAAMVRESAAEIKTAVAAERAEADRRVEIAVAEKEAHIQKLVEMVHEGAVQLQAARTDVDRRIAIAIAPKDRHIAKLEAAAAALSDEAALGYQRLAAAKDQHIAKLEAVIRGSTGGPENPADPPAAEKPVRSPVVHGA